MERLSPPSSPSTLAFTGRMHSRVASSYPSRYSRMWSALISMPKCIGNLRTFAHLFAGYLRPLGQLLRRRLPALLLK